MPTSCKKSCVACKIVIEFNKYGTTNKFFAFAIEQLHKACIAYPSQQYWWWAPCHYSMQFTYMKFYKIYNCCANICTTNGKWVMNLLRNFDFIKARIEKHFSTSMLPTICTMVNLVNFTYFGMLETSTQDVITRCHILVKGFKTKKGNTCYRIWFHYELEHALLAIKVSNIEHLIHCMFLFIHLISFAIIKSYFNNLNVFGKWFITFWL